MCVSRFPVFICIQDEVIFILRLLVYQLLFLSFLSLIMYVFFFGNIVIIIIIIIIINTIYIYIYIFNCFKFFLSSCFPYSS